MKKKSSKVDRNYYLLIGFWFFWIIAVSFVAYLGIVFYNNNLLDNTFVHNFYRMWDWWDGGYFHNIAATGYNEPGTSHFIIRSAFFPLFPMLIRGLSHLIHLPELMNIELSQYLIAHLSFLVWIILFYYFLKTFICPKKPKLAVSSCILAIVFPYNFFFMAGYAESLFMIFVILFFISLYKKQFYLTAVFIALASITRFVGIGLLLILILDIFLAKNKLIIKFIHLFFCSIISISAVAIYSAFLQIKFGKWNWFFLAEASWGRKFSINFLQKLYELIKTNLIFTNHHSILFVNDVFNLFLTLLALGVSIYCFINFRKYLYFGLFILAMLGPALLGGLLLSLARFTIVCFPVYFVIADFMDRKALPLSFLAAPSSLVQSVLILVFTSAIRFIG